MKYYHVIYNSSEASMLGGTGFGLRTATEGTPDSLLKAIDALNLFPADDWEPYQNTPTPEQIMQAMESAKAYGTYSLESAGMGNDDDDAGSVLEKYIGFEDTGYERVELGEIINSVLAGFSDTYRYIFKQRFIENKSQAEIAQKLGVSQMTISRSEKAIVESFKRELNRH